MCRCALVLNVGIILDTQMCFSAKRGTHTGYADVL